MRKVLFPDDLVCSNEHTNITYRLRDKISLLSLSCFLLAASHIVNLAVSRVCLLARLIRAACWACLKICSYSLAVNCLSWAVKELAGSLPVFTGFWSQGTGSSRFMLLRIDVFDPN